MQDADIRTLLGEVSVLSGVSPTDLARLAAVLDQWMRDDLKAKPLKALQGMIWNEGYEMRKLRGVVFDDAAVALRAWHTQKIRLAVYSSGSVLAQKLLFKTAAQGDLTSLFVGFFDTNVGPKRETSSYTRIATELGLSTSDILFLSDAPEELDAAAGAGMQTVQVARAMDGTLPSGRHAYVTALTDIVLT